MADVRVMVEVSTSERIQSFYTSAAGAAEQQLDKRILPRLAGITWDESFAGVEVLGQVEREESDNPRDVSALFDVDPRPEKSTYLVRGTVDEAEIEALQDAAERSRAVVGVYSDPAIQPTLICPGDPPKGSDKDVEKLLCAPQLWECGMDGAGVLVAIVDTGFNVEYLASRGKTPGFDAARSWVPRPGITPGELPVDHGTMCAFDVCIAAPKCTLLDIALLQSRRPGRTIMEGFLSDAVLAYRHLLDVMIAEQRPGECRSLVVNNSWGMFHPSWDFPKDHPGNYSDNPNHPFNRIVGSLERAGADILFAAGNCGKDCPDGRCRGAVTNAIYGANSHPQVLSIAGVDVSKTRVGYSTIGPGRLSRQKPDLSGYTHFKGSGVYPADGGTSAATPVVAGVVAALRTKIPHDAAKADTSPASIRSMLIKTAEDRGAVGYDFEYGWGIVNGCRLGEQCKDEDKDDECIRCCTECCCKQKECIQRCIECCRKVGTLPDLVPVPRPGVRGPDRFCDKDGQGRLLVTVKNQGTAPAGPSTTRVVFSPGGTVDVLTKGLVGGESVTLPVVIPPDCYDHDCDFTITVDAMNVVAEIDETNNTATGICVG